MAVDPDDMEEIVRETVDLYRAAEQAVLAQVTRRLAEGLDAPDWAARRLGALSTLRTSVERILTIVQRASAVAIRAALAAAYRAGQAGALFGIPARLLPRDPDAARAPAVLGEIPRASVIHNLAAALVRDIGERSLNVLRDVLDAYRKVIAQATAASVAGGITRREASQMAFARFVDRGLTSFADRTGRRWRLTSYVEMAVRTVTARAAVQGQTDRQQRLGLQLVIVSNVAGECIRCRPYEGQILRLDQGPTGDVTVPHQITGEPVEIEIRAVLENARRAGFQHPNCRHSLRAYLPGVTKQPAQPTADPEGDLARQRQRAIERNIRRWKEREQAALTPEARAGATARVRKWQNEMREHLKANPALKRLSYREQIGGGNLPTRPAKASPKPAPAAAPKPPEVPDTAKPYMRTIVGVEDLAAAVQRVDDGAERRPILGGSSAATLAVTASDGTRLVHKTAEEWTDDPDEQAASIRGQADAEHLASLLGRTIGAPVVPVYRDSAEAVWMPFLPGAPIGDINSSSEVTQLVAGRDGVLIGLLDHLIANGDRNSGNIMVHNGRITGIDHGFAWGDFFLSQSLPVANDENGSQPAWHFTRDGEWVDNPLTGRDITTLRQRLQALRPDFELLGRTTWLDYSLRILEQLSRHARGTEDQIA
jgi:hypothetical protein